MWVMQALPQDVAVLACTPYSGKVLRFPRDAWFFPEQLEARIKQLDKRQYNFTKIPSEFNQLFEFARILLWCHTFVPASSITQNIGVHKSVKEPLMESMKRGQKGQGRLQSFSPLLLPI